MVSGARAPAWWAIMLISLGGQLGLAFSKANATRLDFVIAGVQKGGTTALGNHLRKCSPLTCLTPTEDPRLRSLTEGLVLHGKIPTLEAEANCVATSPKARFGLEDPFYSYHVTEEVARGVSLAWPKVKFVVLLREPVQRAYSQYVMQQQRGDGSYVGEREKLRHWRTFEEVARDEMAPGRPRGARNTEIVWRGFYDEQLGRLWRYFGQKRVLIVISERVFAGTEGLRSEYDRVTDFIGVPRVPTWGPVFTRSARAPSDRKHQDGDRLTKAAGQLLRDLYVNDTAALYRSLGRVVFEWECWYAEHNLTTLFDCPGLVASEQTRSTRD